MAFWDAWLDEGNHYYQGIFRDDWSRFAKKLADALLSNESKCQPPEPATTAAS
jgi:hypothetical protein